MKMLEAEFQRAVSDYLKRYAMGPSMRAGCRHSLAGACIALRPGSIFRTWPWRGFARPIRPVDPCFTWTGDADIKHMKIHLWFIGYISMGKTGTQRDQAIDLLQAKGIARLSEFRDAGITAATVGRMVRAGDVNRLARGLYQLPGAPLDANHSLAEAAKRVPRGVVCLVSALAYHELTDQLPRAVWMAIGTSDWMPKEGRSAMRIVRFTDALLTDDVLTVHIENVPVKVFGVAKTIADCFRHRRKVGQVVALEGLQEALRQRKASPAEIARHAERGGVATVVRPYLEALTANA